MWEIGRWNETILTTILRSATEIKKVRTSEETCCHAGPSEISPDNAIVKNLQGVNAQRKENVQILGSKHIS